MDGKWTGGQERGRELLSWARVHFLSIPCPLTSISSPSALSFSSAGQAEGFFCTLLDELDAGGDLEGVVDGVLVAELGLPVGE